MRNRKVCPPNMIAQVLLSGEPVSPEAIKEHFANDERMTKVMYRLSIYIGDLRKQGAVVKVQKDGKKVTHYQLANANMFDENGFYVDVSRVTETPVAAPVNNSDNVEESLSDVLEPVVEVLPEVSDSHDSPQQA